MASNSSLYDILGVPPTASFDEIKAAYRRAAMRWHPDRNPGNTEEAERRFKELAAAFAVLSNPAKRDLYDSSAGLNEEHDEAEEDPEIVFLKAMLEMAFAMAMKGYNKDVLIGALIATGCPDRIAQKIASEAIALREKKSPAQSIPQKSTSSSSSLVIIGIAVFLSLFVAFATLDNSKQPSLNPPPSSTANHPTPQKRPSLEDVIASQIDSYDKQNAIGRITYTSLPKEESFSSFSEHIGQPFKIEPIKIIKIPGSNLEILFLSSTPIYKDGSDFSCHACSPILSAMVIEEDETLGYSVTVPLHPLRPAGTWGQVNLNNDFSPTIISPGPKKIGFILKHRDMGQGHIVEWGSIHSIESNTIRQLGEFHVHSDSFGSSQCEGVDRRECPQKDSKIRFDKSNIHNGYYDLVITESSVDQASGQSVRTEKTFRLKFNGVQFAEVPSNQ
jgi:curved DNA-binding protein CbpA